MRYLNFAVWLATLCGSSFGAHEETTTFSPPVPLNSSLATEGKCTDSTYVQPDTTGNALFALQTIQTNWYMAMMSEYGARFTAEVFLGRPAKDRAELLAMNPRALFPYINATDIDGNALLSAYDKHFKTQCGFDGSLKLQFSCECRNSGPAVTAKPDDDDDDDDDNDKTPTGDEVDCNRVGTFGVNIFKIDEENQFILAAICPKSKRKYWFALTRKVPLSAKVIKVIKKEIKKTKVFKKENAIVLEFDV